MEIGKAARRGLRGDLPRDPEILSETRGARGSSQTRGGKERLADLGDANIPTESHTTDTTATHWRKHPEEL